ncbi:MAG: hypothetical protein HWE09_02340 [Cyclobacteriaceae bacterium]|nr:hypothetical protein [Cyclobacteriaceae bacterium]
MLRFFRYIRKNLVEQQKIKSYIFYAIGEIFLVVIGILIALQVNNWNEERKRVKKEKELLVELIKDLERDQASLQFQLGLADTIIASLDYLILLPENPVNLDEKIEQIGEGVLVNYGYTAMNSINTIGIDIIQNMEIRNTINQYYSWWDFGNEIYRSEYDPFHANVWLPFFREHMIRLDTKDHFKRKFTPRNYNQLLEDPEYRDLLIEKRSIFIDFKVRFSRSLSRNLDLRNTIENYIKEL